MENDTYMSNSGHLPLARALHRSPIMNTPQADRLERDQLVYWTGKDGQNRSGAYVGRGFSKDHTRVEVIEGKHTGRVVHVKTAKLVTER